MNLVDQVNILGSPWKVVYSPPPDTEEGPLYICGTGDPKTQTIWINSLMEYSQQVKTLVHEIFEEILSELGCLEVGHNSSVKITMHHNRGLKGGIDTFSTAVDVLVDTLVRSGII